MNPLTPTRTSASEAAQPAAAPRNSQGDQEAWRREMERAQTETWFKPVRSQAAARVPLAEVHAAHGQAATNAVKRPNVWQGALPDPANAGAAAESPAAASASMAAYRALRASQGGPSTPAPQVAAASAPRVAAATAASAPSTPVAAERATALAADNEATVSAQHGRGRPDADPSAVRVHIETDRGIPTVWLGVNGADRSWLPQVMQQIGVRLAQLGYGAPVWYCNGQLHDGKATLSIPTLRRPR